jgi:hypothetical protein
MHLGLAQAADPPQPDPHSSPAHMHRRPTTARLRLSRALPAAGSLPPLHRPVPDPPPPSSAR